MSKKPGSTSACPLGKAAYPTKAKAEAASVSGKAKRCGRCRQWHPLA